MLPIRACLLLLSLAFTPTVISLSLRGVSPEHLKYYQSVSKTFTCLDGGKTIPAAQLNDNYCDCADGTDEPGTAACPNSTFYCRNPGYQAMNLAAQFVDDGVCDCCDGTDEQPGVCKNNCYEASKAMRQELKDKALEVLDAVGLRKQMVADAAVHKQNAIDRLKTINADIEQKEVEVAKLEEELKALEEQEKKEEAEAAAKAEEEEAAAKAAAEQVGEGSTTEASEHPTEESSGEKAEEGEVDAEELGRRIASQWTHDPEAAGTEEGIHEDADLEDAWDPEADAAATEEHSWSHHDDDYKPSPAAEARKKLKAAKREAEALKYQKEQYTKHTAIDLGPGDMFWHLAGNCYSGSDMRFTYEACFYDRATQSEGSGKWQLGDWEGFTDNYKTAVFSGGEQCWDGPKRSFRLELECGKDIKLHSPSEPSTCVYTAKLVTPAACDDALEDQMQKALQQLERIDEELRLASEGQIVHDEL